MAGLLSFLPGLGHIYLGYFQRGLVHTLVFAFLVTLLDSDSIEPLHPFFGIFLTFFYFFTLIDAVRRASAINLSIEGYDASIVLPSDVAWRGIGGSMAGGCLVMLAGFFLLLSTRFGVSMNWLEDWWPLAVIVFGVYIFWKGRNNGAGSGPEQP